MDEWLAQLRDRAKIKIYSDHIPDTPIEEEAEEGTSTEEGAQDSDEVMASEEEVEKFDESTSSQEESTSPE